MVTKYAFKDMKENMARSLSKDLGISAKASIEISNFIRGKTTQKAREILGRVLEYKQPIPFKRFTDGVGHRAGNKIGAGRYPQKAAKEFLRIIDSVEANAQAKGLSTNLLIVHVAVQRGTNQFRSGRQRRRMFKRTHLEIVVEEMEAPKKESKSKTSAKKTVPKTETKVVEKKEAPKVEKTSEVKKEEPKKEEPKKETPKPVEKKLETKPAEKKETKSESKPEETKK